jgi:hypothetical protein
MQSLPASNIFKLKPGTGSRAGFRINRHIPVPFTAIVLFYSCYLSNLPIHLLQPFQLERFGPCRLRWIRELQEHPEYKVFMIALRNGFLIIALSCSLSFHYL